MNYYVYILLCEGNTYYTGITTDYKRRFSEHLGTLKGGAKYTKTHKPIKIASLWLAKSRSEASSCEYFIKNLKRIKKEEIINKPNKLIEKFEGLVVVEITNQDS